MSYSYLLYKCNYFVPFDTEHSHYTQRILGVPQLWWGSLKWREGAVHFIFAFTVASQFHLLLPLYVSFSLLCGKDRSIISPFIFINIITARSGSHNTTLSFLKFTNIQVKSKWENIYSLKAEKVSFVISFLKQL